MRKRTSALLVVGVLVLGGCSSNSSPAAPRRPPPAAPSPAPPRRPRAGAPRPSRSPSSFSSPEFAGWSPATVDSGRPVDQDWPRVGDRTAKGRQGMPEFVLNRRQALTGAAVAAGALGVGTKAAAATPGAETADPFLLG